MTGCQFRARVEWPVAACMKRPPGLRRGTAMNDEKRDGESSGYSSPACLLHEMDGPCAGYLASAELIELLNTLLDGELAVGEVARAGVPESSTPKVLHVLEVAECDA